MMATWTWFGDSAITRTFEGSDEEANARAIAAWRALSVDPPFEVTDVIPAARSVTIVLRPGMSPSEGLRTLVEADQPPSVEAGADHVIAATYDGEDLAVVAALHELSPAELIELHAGAIYTVAFVGFSPGFAYLAGLPPLLQTPRRDSPRTRVPAGSVGIGGQWTGIYPSATPGGWRLIGHAAASLFDAERGALLRPGDRVRFEPA